MMGAINLPMILDVTVVTLNNFIALVSLLALKMLIYILGRIVKITLSADLFLNSRCVIVKTAISLGRCMV